MPAFKDRDLNKGQLRKLTALRKSIGKGIADGAFGEWMASVPKEKAKVVSTDRTAEAIAELLNAPVLDGKIKLPRGGYVVRRGRGRVVVERARS